MTQRSAIRNGVLVLLAALSAACVAAAAGAGAGGGVYLTTRGAESIVRASVDATQDAVDQSFEEFQIRRTEFTRREEPERRELRGRAEDQDLDVTVVMVKQDDGSTRVDVTARRTILTWDKDFARDLLARIIEIVG